MKFIVLRVADEGADDVAELIGIALAEHGYAPAFPSVVDLPGTPLSRGTFGGTADADLTRCWCGAETIVVGATFIDSESVNHATTYCMMWRGAGSHQRKRNSRLPDEAEPGIGKLWEP